MVYCQDMSSDEEDDVLVSSHSDDSDGDIINFLPSLSEKERKSLRERDEEIRRKEASKQKRRREIQRKEDAIQQELAYKEFLKKVDKEFHEARKRKEMEEMRVNPQTVTAIKEYFKGLNKIQGGNIVIAGKYLFPWQENWKNDWFEDIQKNPIDQAILSFCGEFEAIFGYHCGSSQYNLESSIHNGDNYNIMPITDPIARACSHIVSSRLTKDDLQLLAPKSNMFHVPPPKALNFFCTNPGFRACYDLLIARFPPYATPVPPFNTGLGEILRTYAVYYILVFEFLCDPAFQMDEAAFVLELAYMRKMTPISEQQERAESSPDSSIKTNPT
jgi:hypothetical protein